jgi:hypothetical protein
MPRKVNFLALAREFRGNWNRNPGVANFRLCAHSDLFLFLLSQCQRLATAKATTKR